MPSFLWISDLFRIPYADKIWLAAGIIAALASYWFRPNRQEGYLEFTGPIVLVVLAAYMIVLKVPKILWGQLNYAFAQLLFLLIYASVCWFFIRRLESSKN